MKSVQIGSCSFHYAREGEGRPALLFIHGGFCDHEDWVHQVAELRRDFTVVAYDQRCHGASTAAYESFSIEQLAKDVHDLIDALDLEPVIIIGHSLGARVSIQAAADRPGHLAGMVLVDGSRIYAPDDGAKPKAADQPRFSGHPAAFLADRFREMFFQNADPELRDRVVAKVAATPPEAIGALTAASARWDSFGVEQALSTIPPTLPVLAIQSTFHDANTQRYSLPPGTRSTPWLDLLRRYLPQLEVVITLGVGHFTMLEAPTEVSGTVRDFATAIMGERCNAPLIQGS